MKSKFLKLNKSCSENWENMKPNEIGSYCDLCSKNVIDFTQLSQLEISEKIKNSNGNICARISQKQINTPLFDFDADSEKKYKLPYSNIAAGLMIASSLTVSQTLHTKNVNVKTEIVQSTVSITNLETKQSKLESINSKTDNYTVLKGMICSEKSEEPIENAKISFITINKILTTYSLKDGTFSLKVPNNLIDNDNVIRVSYEKVKRDDEKEYFFGYETNDYILSKNEMKSYYNINAETLMPYLGGIGYYSEKNIPIVISNGIEIKYKDFIMAQHGKKSSCSLENKDYFYFEPKIGIAIYGKKAKSGLYILTDKIEQ